MVLGLFFFFFWNRAPLLDGSSLFVRVIIVIKVVFVLFLFCFFELKALYIPLYSQTHRISCFLFFLSFQ